MRVFARRVLYWCAASVAIWCLTLPLLTHQYHLLSPIGLLLNVFLWVPVAMSLFSGFGILLCGAIAPPMAYLCAWLCATSFRFLESVVHYAESLPMSYFWVAGPTTIAVFVFYALLAMVGVNRRLRRHSFAWFFVAAVTTFGLDFFAYTGSHAKETALRCTFLAVGHGTSVVLELPNGQAFLYDAGSLSGPDYPVDAISQCLWHYRVSRIDGVIISHADADHYNAVPGLADRFGIGTVYVSPVMFRGISDSLRQLRDAIGDAGIPVEIVSQHQMLVQNDLLTIEVLHPPSTGVRGSDNANSIVLSLSYLGQRILLTGDLEADGLEQLVRNVQLDCDIAMAPHHGSAHSQPASFSSWCSPEYVVICAGHQRNYERACQPYRGQGVGVFHTARDGAICVTIDDAGCRVGACGGTGGTSEFRQSS